MALEIEGKKLYYVREVQALLKIGSSSLYRCFKKLGIAPKPLGRVKVITEEEFQVLKEHCKAHGKRGRPRKQSS